MDPWWGGEISHQPALHKAAPSRNTQQKRHKEASVAGFRDRRRTRLRRSEGKPSGVGDPSKGGAWVAGLRIWIFWKGPHETRHRSTWSRGTAWIHKWTNGCLVMWVYRETLSRDHLWPTGLPWVLLLVSVSLATDNSYFARPWKLRENKRPKKKLHGFVHCTSSAAPNGLTWNFISFSCG